MNSQHFEEPNLDRHSPPDVSNRAINPQPHQVNASIQRTPYKKELNPTVEISTPQLPCYQTDPNPNPMTAYINFMACRELIANRIQKFDDNPRNFYGWKESFKNMIQDINLTPSEELYIIIEYTSNESRKLAQRLRNAYINKPTEGMEILWQKLSQCFGSDTVITEGHLNKLKDLPKIGFRDNKKLQELGDLLLERQCAKNDGGFIAKLPSDI